MESIESLVSRYGDKIFRLAFKISGHPEDAEDIVQETFIKIQKALPDFRGESHIYTWVYRIALNTAIRHKKRLQPVIDASFDESIYRDVPAPDSFLPDASEQERELIMNEFLYELREKCHFFVTFMLSDEQRIAFILIESMQFSYKDAALILDVSEDVVKSRVYRARQKLKAHFKDRCYWYNPENPCRCTAKAGFVMKKYPQVLAKLKQEQPHASHKELLRQQLSKHSQSIEDIYRSIPELDLALKKPVK